MYRKLFLIFILAATLAAILVIKPWKVLDATPPRIHDRLPEADLIGISNILELSGSMSKTMFYYKLPFRDFLSPGFILSQGKNYGLDIQSPVYVFANESETNISEWGIILSVRDSSKVREGINHLQKFTSISTSNFDRQRIYLLSQYDIQIIYGKDWMLVYQGEDIDRILNRVVYAKHNEISPRWRAFINQYYDPNIRFVASIKSDKLAGYGISSAGVSLSNDSTGLTFTTHITHLDSLLFKVRESGPSYESELYTKYAMNLHFNVDRLRQEPNDPLYKFTKAYSSRIGFPLDQFLEAWEGNVAFREGGYVTINETYIESELDENFNITEVKKTRNVRVPGFALYLQTNAKADYLLRTLENRGILTHEEDKYRLLFSPPMQMSKTDTSIVFHTSSFQPKLSSGTINNVLWSYNYTPIEFILDSTTTKSLYGRIRLPLRKIISDNITP